MGPTPIVYINIVNIDTMQTLTLSVNRPCHVFMKNSERKRERESGVALWLLNESNFCQGKWKISHIEMCVNTVCLRFSHEFRQFSQSQSVFFFSWISGKKCVQDKIFGIFYVQIHENLQICTDFIEFSLSKNQKKVIFARNR